MAAHGGCFGHGGLWWRNGGGENIRLKKEG